MHSGVHADFLWDIVDGKLLVSSQNPKIGVLKEFEAPTSFNNAEQATWFAQGRIDINGDELAEMERQKDRAT